MIDKKKLIKTLRETANILEKSNLKYAHDRYIFYEKYKESTKLLNKFLDYKKFNDNNKCISL